jgi:hypothetical protein
MQIAERDARHATNLKAQINELQKAIAHISRQITIRQVVPGDEEQMQILDEMKGMHDTSRSLQRRATMHLDYLTSLTEDNNAENYAGSTPQLPVVEDEFPDILSKVDSSSPLRPEIVDTADLVCVSTSKSSTNSANIEHRPIQVMSSRRPVNISRPSSAAGAGIREATPDIGSAISAQDFEDQLSVLLASAASEQMETGKPISDDLISQVANKLDAVGKKTWSERPRTYLVLRLVDHVRVMETFIFQGFKTSIFPTPRRLFRIALMQLVRATNSLISNVTS